jgi:hypothetical protein
MGSNVTVGVSLDDGTTFSPIPVTDHIWYESIGIRNEEFPFSSRISAQHQEPLWESSTVQDELWNDWSPTARFTDADAMPGALFFKQYSDGQPAMLWEEGDVQRFLSPGTNRRTSPYSSAAKFYQTLGAMVPAPQFLLTEHFAVRWRGGLRVVGGGQFKLQMTTGDDTQQDFKGGRSISRGCLPNCNEGPKPSNGEEGHPDTPESVPVGSYPWVERRHRSVFGLRGAHTGAYSVNVDYSWEAECPDHRNISLEFTHLKLKGSRSCGGTNGTCESDTIEITEVHTDGARDQLTLLAEVDNCHGQDRFGNDVGICDSRNDLHFEAAASKMLIHMETPAATKPAEPGEGFIAFVSCSDAPLRPALHGDNGALMYIDGERVIDSAQSASQPGVLVSQTERAIALSPGTHDLTLAYFQRSGVARLAVEWKYVSDVRQAAGWIPLSSSEELAFGCSGAPGERYEKGGQGRINRNENHYMHLNVTDLGSLVPTGSSANCQSCPVGRYTGGQGQATCQDCSPGRFSGSVGATSDSVCIPCAPGFADLDQRPDTPCVQCAFGEFQNLNGTIECQPCAAGTYSMQHGAVAAESCSQCSAGQMDSDVDATTPCVLCQRDTYSNETGVTVCKDCPLGRGVGFMGATSEGDCLSCPLGKVDHDQLPTTPCVGCPPGKYQDFFGGQFCIECGGGKYQPGHNATSLLNCTECPAGQYDNDNVDRGWASATTPCQNCSAGKYNPTAAMTSCPDCSAGRSQPRVGVADSSECHACGLGEADLDSNPATECEPCSAGRYQSERVRTTCNVCGPGTHQPDVGAQTPQDCLPCAAGKSDNDADPATSCVTCPIGKFRSESIPPAYDNPTKTLIASLPPGTFCYDCPYGSEQLAVGQTELEDCASCPAGKSDVDRDPTTACFECVAGFYARDPPPSTTEGSGRYGEIGSATGCTQCAGSEDQPLYSTVSGHECLQDCPTGQFGRRIVSTVSDLLDALIAMKTAEATEQESVFGSWEDGTDVAEQNDTVSAGRRVQEELPMNLTLYACVECDAGTEQLQTGQLETTEPFPCFGCTVGRSDDDNNPSTECAECRPGQFSADQGATECMRCATGQYTSPDLDECVLPEECPAGSFIDDTLEDGLSACSFCQMGMYNADPGQAACELCPPTTQNNLTGSISSDACRLCDDGSSTIYPGSAYCDTCAVGEFGQDGYCWPCDAKMRCNAEGLGYPEANPGFWIRHFDNWDAIYIDIDPAETEDERTARESSAMVERCPAGVCPSLVECSPPQGCSHGGLHNCSDGYTNDRCTDCAARHFRLNSLCEVCPDDAIPVYVYVMATFGILLFGAVAVEWIWSTSTDRNVFSASLNPSLCPFCVLDN